MPGALTSRPCVPGDNPPRHNKTKALQAALDIWAGQSGRTPTEISQTPAFNQYRPFQQIRRRAGLFASLCVLFGLFYIFLKFAKSACGTGNIAARIKNSDQINITELIGGKAVAERFLIAKP